MRRKRFIIGILAAAMLTVGAFHNPRVSQIVSSARSFGAYFQAMGDAAASWSPVERFAYSMVLANSRGEGARR